MSGPSVIAAMPGKPVTPEVALRLAGQSVPRDTPALIIIWEAEDGDPRCIATGQNRDLLWVVETFKQTLIGAQE